MSTDLFAAPISTGAPDALFPRRDGHPVRPVGNTGPVSRPIETNKFYTNLVIGSQTQSAWTLPYVLWVDRNPSSWGLSVSHTNGNQFALGPDGVATARYWISPLGIKSICFGATEFNSSSSITTAQHKEYSVDLSLHANIGSNGTSTKKIVSHLVLGMGFVTARYYDLRPVIHSGVMFRGLERATSPRAGVDKWRVTLQDSNVWLIYICPEGRPTLNLTLENNTRIVGNYSFTGFIQVTKLPTGSAEGTIDQTAGAFPTTTRLTASASADGRSASYQFNHSRYGTNNAGALLMYALPHHMASFEASTTARHVLSTIKLQTPTKGLATAVVADQWRLVEHELPTQYATWLPNNGGGFTDSAIRSVIERHCRNEIQADFVAGTNIDSMYFSGKALAKYAQLVLVACDVLKDESLTRNSLEKLKAAMDRFAANRQKYRLVYETTWKGIVSDALFQTGDQMMDFGNGNYNDHHFHYGYHIYTAAVIGHVELVLNRTLDWAARNRNWVNTLIRDVANPSEQDPYFPVSRSFDWWHGHSWAKGIFESADGKDQESTSEDYNYAYSQHLWALVNSDRAMSLRALLMLSIMKRSFNTYFLLSSSNTVQPSKFIANKVTGILFENKVDYATYFGMNEEFIHGIHMLPLTPISPYIRREGYVREEWMAKFNGKTSGIDSGWKGILYANLALCEPRESWRFFAQDGFQSRWLDDGATRTWYLTMAAGLMAAKAAGTRYRARL
ncbi:endo-1,3(4)-beta-glucanase [Kalaharituber pfeilii]|nr:endo-1,3(4)-beta-glucanase [Kalaharituber pfeilii]